MTEQSLEHALLLQWYRQSVKKEPRKGIKRYHAPSNGVVVAMVGFTAYIWVSVPVPKQKFCHSKKREREKRQRKVRLLCLTVNQRI